MEDYIRDIRKQGDTVGGIVNLQCTFRTYEPFDKLHAELGKAMLSICCKRFEFGSGFDGSQMKGSEHNDLFNANGSTRTNLSGGIQGGISNGMDIYFRVALSPLPQLCKTRIIRQYRCNY
jgi:chorismate synthase